MKIQGRCKVCERSFPIDLVVAVPETAGHCPLCGDVFDQSYGALVVQGLENLQRAATALERAIETVTRMGHTLELDDESVLRPIREALATGKTALTAAGDGGATGR